MDDLKIYVDRLKFEKTERISLVLSADFLDVKEEELVFADPIEVNLRAYLTGEDLVVHIAAKTKVMQPCAICNKMFTADLIVEDECHIQEISSIKGGIFDASDSIREAILLEVSAVVECHGGHCPERKHLQKYLASDESDGLSGREEGLGPFDGLDITSN